MCFGIYRGTEQAGFGRVVTDRATFGYLCDVFVLASHQGQGIARAMVTSLVDHPTVATVGRFLLATADAHGVYEALGFATISSPERWMERRRS